MSFVKVGRIKGYKFYLSSMNIEDKYFYLKQKILVL